MFASSFLGSKEAGASGKAAKCPFLRVSKKQSTLAGLLHFIMAFDKLDITYGLYIQAFSQLYHQPASEF